MITNTATTTYKSYTNTNVNTRNSAIADKPLDMFRGQSRSPNMVPFHMAIPISVL